MSTRAYACVHACMYAWLDVWMCGCMDVKMYGCMDGWMDGCDAWVHRRMDVCMYVCMYVRMFDCCARIVMYSLGNPGAWHASLPAALSTKSHHVDQNGSVGFRYSFRSKQRKLRTHLKQREDQCRLQKGSRLEARYAPTSLILEKPLGFL